MQGRLTKERSQALFFVFQVFVGVEGDRGGVGDGDFFYRFTGVVWRKDDDECCV